MATTDIPQLMPWIHRGLSLFCLGSLVPAAFMAAGQLESLAGWWLVVFGCGIIVVTLAMAVASLTGRRVNLYASLYVVLVLGGVLLWPAAWTSPVSNPSSPWLWMCIGVASVWTALLVGIRWGFLYALTSAAAFAAVRLTPSGEGIGLVAAAQDMLILVVNPCSVIIAISLLVDAVSEMEASLARWRQHQARAAVEEALVEERHRLDRIVHDEVMTTLVSAAKAGAGPDQQVSGLARHALGQLEAAAGSPEDGGPVTAEHLAWLVEDAVRSTCPGVEITVRLPVPGLLVPQEVASAFAQAAREAATNAVRHATAARLTVRIGGAEASYPGVQVLLRDNGEGFDPTSLPVDRYGVRRSIIGRMQGVGGQAEVRSSDGQGTTVVLRWVSPARSAKAHPPQRSLPGLSAMSPRTLAALIWVIVGLNFVLGWTSLNEVSSAATVIVAQVLAAAGTWLALYRLERHPMPTPAALGVVGLLLLASGLVNSVLPHGHWPGYATWHSSVVMALMIVVLFRGHPAIGWLGVGGFMVVTVVWAFSHGLGWTEAIRVGFGTISWMAAAHLMLSWLQRLGHRVNREREASVEANQNLATSYSRLVLRDIWLRDLRGQVGGLLETMADEQRGLSEAELAACVAVEQRLREGLRASNLLSPEIQTLIDRARGRGIEVTLVDSRQTPLPATVKASLRKLIVDLLETDGLTKMVARAAPAGYQAVVTVMSRTDDGTTTLVSLDDNGEPISR